MARVRVPPNLIGPFLVDHLQRNRSHRRHRSELDEPLGLGMAQLGRNTRNGVEARDEEAGSPFGAGLVDHGRIFAVASDGPSGTRLVPGRRRIPTGQ